MTKHLSYDTIKLIKSFIKKEDSEYYNPTSTIIKQFIKTANNRLHIFELEMFEKYLPYIVADILKRIDDEDIFTNQLIFYHERHQLLKTHAVLSEIIFKNHHL